MRSPSVPALAPSSPLFSPLVRRLLQIDVLQNGLCGILLEAAIRILLEEILREIRRRQVSEHLRVGRLVGQIDKPGVYPFVDGS